MSALFDAGPVVKKAKPPLSDEAKHHQAFVAAWWDRWQVAYPGLGKPTPTPRDFRVLKWARQALSSDLAAWEGILDRYFAAEFYKRVRHPIHCLENSWLQFLAPEQRPDSFARTRAWLESRNNTV